MASRVERERSVTRLIDALGDRYRHERSPGSAGVAVIESLRTLIRRQLEPRDDPRPLALLRILLALCTIANVATLWPLAGFQP